MTGNEAAIKVLKELLELSPDELRKKIEEAPRHEITTLLDNAGYFERLVRETCKHEDQFPFDYDSTILYLCPRCGAARGENGKKD